ncbi:hypothetical protein M2163_001064 [Streptomyces sp. SAI-135]|jgi:hypothetical protein|nr:hypothetical protein [Streptomyces sp. SAI-090]MDH6573311.1 hypothetical protein [Streptomyces sp. SAI-117]MDH6613956.1 hypothetical protein [Streptomyces sp. SAI-135]
MIRYLAEDGGAAWPALLGIIATVIFFVLIYTFMRNR